MSQTLYPPPGPQAIGQVLDNAFRLFQASLIKCLPYGILSMILGQFANIVFLLLGRPLQPFGGGGALWWALYVVGTLAALVLYAALILRQRSIANAQATAAAREIYDALQHLPGLIVVFLLMIFVPGICVGLLVGLGAEKAGVLLIALSLLLLIPATYLFTALSFSWHSLLLTQRGPLLALRHSWYLVTGNWWRVSLIYSVAFVVVVVFYVVAMVAVVIAMQFAGAQDIVMASAASAVLFVALGALVLPFFSAVLLATFNDLTLRKGGADLERST